MKNDKVLGVSLVIIAIIGTAFAPILYNWFVTEFNLSKEQGAGPLAAIAFSIFLIMGWGLTLLKIIEK